MNNDEIVMKINNFKDTGAAHSIEDELARQINSDYAVGNASQGHVEEYDSRILDQESLSKVISGIREGEIKTVKEGLIVMDRPKTEKPVDFFDKVLGKIDKLLRGKHEDH